MRDSTIKLNVADLVVSLTTDPGVHVLGHVDSFRTDGPANVFVNVRFNHENITVDGCRQLSVGGDFGWNAFMRPDDGSILVERLGGNILVQFAPEPECEVVDVLLRAPEGDCSVDGSWPERELLLVEILPVPVVVLLAGRKGLFLHSCAVAYEENGILLSGVSGSGKSTMAELWRRHGPLVSSVIDDEHIITRRFAESTLLFGAPWTRGPREATFSRTPLKVIFFLSHARSNRCVRLSPSEALAQLLSQVFLPVWSRQQLDLTVQTCADLLQGVECYCLQFVPDPSVIGFVQDILGGSR